MKNLFKLLYIVILSTFMTGCGYSYNMPDLYVEYKFKVSVNNSDLIISSVDNYGYEFLGQDIICYFIDNEGNIKNYHSNLWPDDIFTLKRDYSFFQIKQVCYGKPKIPGSHKIEVCTIIYKSVDMGKFKLYGEEQEPCPGMITFGIEDVEKIEYNPDAKKVYTIMAKMEVDPKYVTDYGYRYAGESSFYEFFDADGILKETKQSSPGGPIYTSYLYTGGYSIYYGFSSTKKIEICKVYFKKELSNLLGSPTSKFVIDRIDYYVDRINMNADEN